MATQPPAIACDLGSLSPAERERRATLARTLVGRASSIQELTDGYALELPATEAVVRNSRRDVPRSVIGRLRAVGRHRNRPI